MKTRTKLSFLITCICCLGMVMVLGACTGIGAGDEDAEMTNSQYMSKVNSVMDDLKESFETFNTAVANKDLVGIRARAHKAFKAIDDLEGIEAPEAVKDIQQGYVDGCRTLQDTLNGYIDLYAEIETATETEPFDYGTYSDRLENLQKTYEEGIDKLKEADKKATELQS